MIRVMLSIAFTLALLSATPAADPKPVEPFNGNDLKGWKIKNEKQNHWKLGDPGVTDPDSPVLGIKKSLEGTRYSMINLLAPNLHGTDIYTEEKFGDVLVELEFMIPKGSNSGVYLMGEYEVQILDSYGKPDDKLGQGDLGALYSAAAPKKNACEEARRVAEVRHRLPGAEIRRRQEDREREVHQGHAQRCRAARERRDERADARAV